MHLPAGGWLFPLSEDLMAFLPVSAVNRPQTSPPLPFSPHPTPGAAPGELTCPSVPKLVNCPSTATFPPRLQHPPQELQRNTREQAGVKPSAALPAMGMAGNQGLGVQTRDLFGGRRASGCREGAKLIYPAADHLGYHGGRG